VTYAAIFYLVNGSWVPVTSGWGLDVEQLVYRSPVFPVFVWWWTGSSWTSEVVYDNGQGGGTAAGAGLTGPRPPAGLGVVTGQDVATIATIGLEIAVVVGGLYGLYLLVRKRR